MLHNYLKTAVRNFLRHKGYTFLNISGLTVGLACSLLILLWIKDEVGMDRFHQKDARLYQMLRNIHLAEGEIMTILAVPQPVAVMLDNEYPEVEAVSLIGWEIEFLFQKEDIAFRESGRYVSPAFFKIFTYPFLAGDSNTAMDDLNSVLISERLASKYFGSNWKANGVIGQTLRIDNSQDFTITAVLKNPPSNSSLQFDWIIPAQEYIRRNNWVENWENGGFRMAFTLKEGADVEAFSKKVEQEINNHTNNTADERLFFQKFSDRYLHATFTNGVNTGGRIDYVRILLLVAIFILVIACINFMNLATARSSQRAKEIGLRKVLGARRGILGVQFLTESLLISLVSVVLAVLLVYLLLPWFNQLTGKVMALDFTNPQLWIVLVGITVITGFLSGSYPALLLPSFEITSSLKGTLKHSIGSTFIRKGLVVFQFAISILLIIGTVVVYRQMNYIMNKNLGLDRENLVFIEMEGETAQRFESYKIELLKIPEVHNVTSTSGNPLSYGRSSSSPTWEGKDLDQAVEMNILMVSTDFIETMDMEMIYGRGFSVDYRTDSANFIINEEAARIMGFENPVGKRLSVWGMKGQIIGMLKNFHMSSMYEPIAPLVIRYDPQNTFVAFIRIRGNTQDALLAIEQVTTNFNPSFPFTHKFLDLEYEQSYKNEMTISTLSNIFAVIAIFISCLGLFGLSSFSAEQRTKEIGIRKVLGASVGKLVLLLSKDFTQLILLSFIISAPFAYYLTSGWLDKFVYKTELGLNVFIISGIAAILIGGFTVSFKSFQAASANPVDTLKEE